jgi:DnaJ family protein A protein 5
MVKEQDILTDFMPYFATSAFSGYDDSPKGFYTVYRNLFDTLLQQEALEDGKVLDFKLSFGTSTSPGFAELKQFYTYWSTFSTKLSFSWCDIYDLNLGINRRIRRQAEKENKKARDSAKKEFNDDVRALANFVQRKDLRYKKLQEEKRMADEAKAAIEARKRYEKKMEDLANFTFEEQEWMKVEEKTPYKEFIESDEENEGEEADEHYCVVCEKYFRSDKQLRNHEKSKKHLKALEELKEIMRQDDELAQELDELNFEYEDDHESVVATDEENDDLKPEPTENHQKEDKGEKHLEDDVVKEEARAVDKKDDEDNSDSGSSSLNERLQKAKATAASKKKDNKNAQAEKKKRRRKDKEKKGSGNSGESCNVCHASFPTRNKLFQHIKETGHALRK